jgi:enoyl-CoA hydratase
MTEKLLVEKRGPVGWITFNQPEKRNAVSVEMWEAIPPALEKFGADPEVRVIVLKGAGDKAFVSGADISQFEKQRSSAEAVQYYEQIGDRAQSMIYDCEKPTVAMIRGFCIGGGLNIALCCDLRIAAEDARFGIPAARMGLGYRPSSMKKLIAATGAANALEVMLTSKQFNAAEAKAMGLVHRVVPVPELETATQELLDGISANAPLTMAASKTIIRELVKPSSAFDAAACDAAVKKCFASDDYKEGRTAFMEKRKPVFQGR